MKKDVIFVVESKKNIALDCIKEARVVMKCLTDMKRISSHHEFIATDFDGIKCTGSENKRF